MEEKVKTICTGFQDVNWEFLFRKSKIDHGKKLYDAGHIFSVTETCKPGFPTEISGFCIPQTKVNQSAYRLYVKIDEERNVIRGALNCSCDFGAGGENLKV